MLKLVSLECWTDWIPGGKGVLEKVWKRKERVLMVNPLFVGTVDSLSVNIMEPDKKGETTELINVGFFDGSSVLVRRDKWAEFLEEARDEVS